MEIIWTRTKTLVTVSLLLLVGAAWGVKHFYFPSVADKFFQLDYQRLQTAPANVLIFRRTIFTESRRAGVMAAPAQNQTGRYEANTMRLLGRNASFAEVMALAYQCQDSRLVLPPGAPTNHFDLLVTKSSAYERLQKKIKSKLGYTARWQDRETDVLELRVRTPNAAGLRLATGAQNSSGSEYKNGKLLFHHAPVRWIISLIENAVNHPIEDRTGLMGNYDFALAWNWRGRSADPEATALKQSLAELGLELVPASASLQMMVVERAK